MPSTSTMPIPESTVGHGSGIPVWRSRMNRYDNTVASAPPPTAARTRADVPARDAEVETGAAGGADRAQVTRL